MPMPHRTNYQWKSNDNGSITNHRYDIEAEKWVDAIDKATFKARPTDWAADLQFFGVFFTFIHSLLIIIFFIPILLIKELVGYQINVLPGDPPSGWIDKRTSYEKLDARINALKEKYKDTGHPKLSEDDVQRIVAHVRAKTAKAKERANLNKL